MESLLITLIEIQLIGWKELINIYTMTKIAWFSEMGFNSKTFRSHRNMRTEFAWFVAQEAMHHNILKLQAKSAKKMHARNAQLTLIEEKTSPWQVLKSTWCLRFRRTSPFFCSWQGCGASSAVLSVKDAIKPFLSNR